MTTLYYYHPDFLKHLTGHGHPESPERLKSIEKILSGSEFNALQRMVPPLGTAQDEQVLLVHAPLHLKRIKQACASPMGCQLDADTVLSAGSANAALRAVGAACDAVDQIMSKQASRAFCAVRPPGHHAEPALAMGFCLFNNVAIAAEYARTKYQLERIAIVDFDVHHGNGTQAIFKNQAQVMYASTHEMPNFPGTGYPSETGMGNIVNVPLHANTEGEEFRKKFIDIIFPALEQFKPQILLLSSGFDAHKDDPLASIQLVEEDFRWLTRKLVKIANKHAEGRVISVLEGGYNLTALAASVAVHVKELLASD
jgi:acetoin utilization deacetylase AcuC-like enzyme